MERRIILRVYENKKSGQKLVCIPKKYNKIKSGDFVEVIRREIK